MAASKVQRHFLPDDVVPESYDLDLRPDFERFSYDGTVVVDCEVRVATDTVALHAKELSVFEAFFQADGGAKVEAESVVVNKKEMTVSLIFGEVLPVGSGKLTLKFTGVLNDQMKGFYRSTYRKADGTTGYLATTHFEPIDARRAFPCWDEPARKAVFNVTLTVPPGMTGVSMMPEKSCRILPDGWKRISFLPTPKMSSYIVAFCVGEFDFLQQRSESGTLVRVLCCPGKVEECSFALRCAVRSLEYYNKFCGIPYPLPKMDLIAVPDFPIGAMENWGLITYRESALLCDEATASTVVKQRICTIVAHEISHMWFGNLVTMTWWDDLWLKEGFATWMQTFCTDALFPDWGMWHSYVATHQQHALGLDAMRSSHPIEVPIARAEEAEEVFDAISYAKGGSVVRMAHALLGEEFFATGLRAYFVRHQYGNTETSDLWRSWAEASSMPIPEIMGSWTQKMGFPMLTVIGDPFDGSGTVEVEQQWFLADGSVEPGDEEQLWIVPVIIGTDKGVSEAHLLRERRQKLPVTPGSTWLKLNAGQHVPCRVLYPAPVFERLAAVVATLPVEDRIGLLSDALALCRAGHLPMSQVVGLLRGFAAETNDKVWDQLDTVLGGMSLILRRSVPEEAYNGFLSHASRLVGPCAARVGWTPHADDDDNSRRLRQTMVGLLAGFSKGDASVVSAARAQCDAFLAGSPVSKDVRVAVLKISLAADAGLFDRLMAAHKASDDSAVRMDIYACLGASPTEELLVRAMDWSLTEEVRPQDMFSIIGGVATGSRGGPELALEWIRGNIDGIGRRVTPGSIIFSRCVEITGAGFATEEEACAVRDFWEGTKAKASIQKKLRQVLEMIRTRAKFAKRLEGSDVASLAYWQTLAA